MHILDTLDYLKTGNSKQQAVYQLLIAHAVFNKLESFSPILTGTIPINVDIDNSDLDIACHWSDKIIFRHVLTTEFAQYENFMLEQKSINQVETIICSFTLDNFKLEIFGQNKPTKTQDSYQHMIMEYGILKIYGEDFRQQIVQLKKSGYKTEPAFAQLLQLKGNPYEALLHYKLP